MPLPVLQPTVSIGIRAELSLRPLRLGLLSVLLQLCAVCLDEGAVARRGSVEPYLGRGPRVPKQLGGGVEEARARQQWRQKDMQQSQSERIRGARHYGLRLPRASAILEHYHRHEWRAT